MATVVRAVVVSRSCRFNTNYTVADCYISSEEECYGCCGFFPPDSNFDTILNTTNHTENKHRPINSSNSLQQDSINFYQCCNITSKSLKKHKLHESMTEVMDKQFNLAEEVFSFYMKMKKSDSLSSLVKVSEKSERKRKTSDIEKLHLRRSFSEDQFSSHSNNNLPATQARSPRFEKFRHRVFFGFRSLRKNRILKENTKALSATNTDQFDINCSDPHILAEASSCTKKKKERKIANRFQFRKGKKAKCLESKLTTTCTQTSPSSLDHTGETVHLNLSRVNLVNFPASFERETYSVPFDKIRKLKITISGRKSETNSGGIIDRNLSTILDQSLEGIEVNSKKGPAKLNITRSEVDIPPKEQAPIRPDQLPNYCSVASKHSQQIGTFSERSGAVKKIFSSISNQGNCAQCTKENCVSMHNSDSYERDQNLVSDFQSVDCADNIHDSKKADNLKESNCEEFKVLLDKSEWVAKRPEKPPHIRNAFKNCKYSIDEINDIESSDPTAAARRRRIKYVVQPTFCAGEESKISEESRDVSCDPYDSGELSFDSASSVDCQMSAFGDGSMNTDEAPIVPEMEKREHLYKILVIGELGTGKTSFIKRYVHQFFSANYRATIGVDFALKVLHWDENTIVRLQLWDIAGQERFGNMTRVYYKEAVGAFIVFDVTRSGTFDAVCKWKEDLDSKVQLPDGSPIPCILLANKCDQEKQGMDITPERMNAYSNDNGFAGWFETSAKENINIEEAARALVNKILLNDKLITTADILDNNKFALGSGQQTNTVKKNCSC